MSNSMGSDRVDPFEGKSIMYLNPRTFRHVPNDEKSTDLEGIHQQMLKMVLKSPHKGLEKAKSVLDGGSELLNTKENDANANNKENLQERRPALARKRAQFSLKPDSSQPTTTLEPSFQIDQLQNPEDFFAAYEKFENTRKEMKRQRGGEDLNEVKNSMNARRRRPEISRRKVSYKHHDYSTNSQSAMLSSQEILEDDIRNPPTQDSEQESIILNDSHDEKLAGPVTKTENKINELFDELLSSDIHRLDGNEALSLLKDRLKIKPVDIDNLDLPDFNDVGRFNFVSHGNNLLKDSNRLSTTCTLPERLISKTPGKKMGSSTSPNHLFSSPTPPRSPLLAISTFAKRLSNSISVSDQLPACDINSFLITRSREITGSKGVEFPVSGTLDLSAKDKIMNTEVGAVSPKASIGVAVSSSQKSPRNKMHDLFGTRLEEAMIGLEDHDQCNVNEDKDMDGYTNVNVEPNEGSSTEELTVSDTLDLSAKDKIMNTEVGAVSPKASIGVAVSSSQKSPHNKMHDLFGTRLEEAMIGLEDHDQCDMNEDKDMDGYTNVNVEPNEGSSTEGNVEDIVQKAASFTQSTNMEGFTDNIQLGDIEENVEDGHQKEQLSMSPEVNTEVSMEENLKRNSSQPDNNSDQMPDLQGTKSTVDDAAITTSQIPDIDSETQHEHQPEPTINKRKKKGKCSPDLRKKRQSLADAGTSWTSGVRRSQRVRSRPLEYWRGERFLYGRVHNSLPTVIGLKYMASEGDSSPGFKVESYVSNEHKELLDLVALH